MNDCDVRQEFARRMQVLRKAAGDPGYRDIARRSRTDISHTTVSHIFNGYHVPRWPYVRAVIECLGGDSSLLEPLWKLAFDYRPPPPETFEYVQLDNVPVAQVADIYNQRAVQGWLPVHVFELGKGKVSLVMCRRGVEADERYGSSPYAARLPLGQLR